MRLSLALRRIGSLEAVVAFVTSLFLFISISATLVNDCVLCESGRLPPAVDIIAALLLVGAGILLRVRRPRNAIWLLLVAAGWGRLIEVTLIYLAEANVEVMWHSLRNLLLVAVPWHIAIVFPTGRALTRFRWLVGAWYTWAIGASIVRGAYVDWDHVGVKNWEKILRTDEAVWSGWELVLARLGDVSDLLILVSVIAVLARWRRGNHSVRRAFTPVFFFLPLLLLDILAGGNIEGFDFEFLTGISVITQQVVAFGLPAVVVLGIVGPRVWEGRIALLIDNLETAVTLAQVETATRRALDDDRITLLTWLPDKSAWRTSLGNELDEPGGAMHTEVTLDGDLLGAICHDETSDLPLMASIASTVAFALRRIQLQAEVEVRLEEVRRSRQRIVEAADDARKAIERDLHDGAQQSLVILAMSLDLEKAKFSDPEVHRVFDEAAANARRALEEIRSLSQGMYPPALTSDGLRLAVEGLADASPIPTTVSVVDGRFDHRAETTAYFVVAECLANAAKHARADHIAVRISKSDDAVIVEVADDGVGGAAARQGGGIEGLGDRVSAIGGALEVWSPEAGGTTVHAVIPLETADQRSG